MRNEIKLFFVLSAILGLMASTQAKTWHVASQITTQNSYVLTDRSLWLDEDNVAGTGAPEAGDDLVLAVDRVRFRGADYLGNSVRIGQGAISTAFDWDAVFSTTFRPDSKGLILENGICRFARQTTTYQFTGPVSVESSESRPFTFMFTNTSDSKATITGPVTGATGTAIAFGCCAWWSNGRGEVCKTNTTFVLGNVDGYAGSVIVTSAYENVGSAYGTCLQIGSTTSACHVAVWEGGVLTTTNTAVAARVGSISFHKGSRLLLNGNASARTVGCISATGMVSIADGPLDVRLIAGLRGTDALRVPILAGSVESAFTEADFRLDNASGIADTYFPDIMHLEVAVDEETGLRTLYLVTFDVTKTSSYTDEGHPVENRAGQGSSLTNAAAWSDGRIPHAHAIYYVSNSLRTLNEPESAYDFPGEAIWLKGGQLWLTVAQFFVPRIYASNASTIGLTRYATNGVENVVRVKTGRMHLLGGSLTLRAWAGQSLWLDCEMEGNGTISIDGIHTSTGAPDSTYELCGINTNFTGNVKVCQSFNLDKINYAYRHLTLVVNDGRNLGGTLEVFAPRALALSRLAFLSVTNTAKAVTLQKGMNRGVYIGDRACFNVASGATLDVEQPILLGGKLWKDGEGTLILGGAMRHEVSDGGDLTDVPRAGSNLVELVAGTVKIRNADAFAGAQVMVDNGAELVVDLAGSDDEGLKRYGIRNVTAETPFALGAGLSALPLALAVSTTETVPTTATNALFTIKATALPALRGILPSAKTLNPWPTLPARYVYQSDAESGYVTVALESHAYGTVFTLR